MFPFIKITCFNFFELLPFCSRYNGFESQYDAILNNQWNGLYIIYSCISFKSYSFSKFLKISNCCNLDMIDQRKDVAYSDVCHL